MGVDPLMLHGYQTLSPIANGAFSKIERARHHATQTEVAVKTFNKQRYLQPANAHLLAAMQNELSVLNKLKGLNHGGIANVIEIVDDPQNIRAILQYCGGGSLQRLMTKVGAGGNMAQSFGIGAKMSQSIAGQVAAALEVIHRMGIAHRDVKPDNILFVDGSHTAVKLCDFGFAISCQGKKVRTVCGTPQYMSPELAGASLQSRKPYDGPAVDMWAFGCLAFEMLEGKPAFRAVSVDQLNMRIAKASHETFTAASPPPARAVVKACLELNAEKRMTSAAAITHPWLRAKRSASRSNSPKREAPSSPKPPHAQ